MRPTQKTGVCYYVTNSVEVMVRQIAVCDNVSMRVLLCGQHTKLELIHLARFPRAQNVRPTQKTGGYSSAIIISASVRPTQKIGV